MRSLFLLALPAWATALTIPSLKSSQPRDSSPDIRVVAGSTDPRHVSIQFQSPCQGCFVGTEEGLEFELFIPSSEVECRGPPPMLNGLALGHDGHGVLKTKLSNGLGDRDIMASWQSSCLEGQASWISVNVHGIVGLGDANEASGFTTSFRQTGHPEILRLSNEPLELTHAVALAKTWLHPSKDQRLVIVGPTSELTSADALREEYQKLGDLKAKLHNLAKEIHHQEAKILHLLQEDFRACDGITCLVKTAMRKLPEFAELLKHHFHSRPSSHQETPIMRQGDGDLVFNCSRAMPWEDVGDIMHDELDGSIETTELPYPPAHSEGLSPGPPSPPHKGENPHPPFFDGPPSFPHGDHPPPPGHSGDRLPPPPGHHGDHLPPPPGPHGNHESPPMFGDHHHHRHHHHLLKVIPAFVLLLVLGSLLFRHFRKNCELFRSPRRSADRAARREERHNRRAFRSAARRHKWVQWWNRYRRPCSTTDYEEKRDLILDQENVLEDAMQGEIRSLQQAHEIIGEIMRAEAGRERLYYEVNLPPSRRPMAAAELDAGLGSSRMLEPLPRYMQAPPLYEEELEGDMTVVDGFRYTPTSSEATPDSSVVDCSPRLSFETGRTMLMNKAPRD